MQDEEPKNDRPERPADHKRERLNQPTALPGIRRFQFFSDLSDRPLTRNLNRLGMLGIAVALGTTVAKAVHSGVPQTIYCYECRACYGTQDHCPVGIAFQAELTVSSRVSDYERFLKAKGMKCIRCGNCASYCVVNLNLPRIFARMQANTMAAIKNGRVPRRAVREAFENGWINRLYIREVANWLREA